ncbi:hypothetical protein [Brevundimonas sp.]|uniref:spike base protein, RCAP_Rcc01079 family n=1 Tax=Brevundimonas sp. TaxID=1871086 RepID=UPI001A314DD1|nr:hypothetical protein [Brevundimonas sp.]MBJ7486361.1 hypothetical protein [Brevundimonas sp.]
MPSIPDAYSTRAPSAGSPARRVETVTPSDATDLSAVAKALYVGIAGDVRLIPAGTSDDTAVTLRNHPVGYLAVQTRRVLATGTTAEAILALFD